MKEGGAIILAVVLLLIRSKRETTLFGEICITPPICIRNERRRSYYSGCSVMFWRRCVLLWKRRTQLEISGSVVFTTLFRTVQPKYWSVYIWIYVPAGCNTNASFEIGFIVLDTASQYSEGCDFPSHAWGIRPITTHRTAGQSEHAALLRTMNFVKIDVFQKGGATLMYSMWKIMCF